MKRVLWLEPDKQISPYITFLEINGYEVVQEGSLSSAEVLIAKQAFDAVILDVMVATTDAEEGGNYPITDTDLGLQSGLVFYSRIRELVEKSHIPVIVLTQRLDNEIRRRFIDSGLPPNLFIRKIELPEVTQFLSKINEILK